MMIHTTTKTAAAFTSARGFALISTACFAGAVA